MQLGIMADIHGNDVALRAILGDAERLGVDRWWVLGDLVLFGPRPAEVLELLNGLPGVGLLSGNCDRYVLTGEQPEPHATAAAAAASLDLIERYALVAAGSAWTRGVLDQAGLLGTLDGLPADLRLELPSGASLLGVHASPRADDGPGIDPHITDDHLRELLAGCGAGIVAGGHTHMPTDRVVDGVRALNPGSAGQPRTCGVASWLTLQDDGGTVTVTHHGTPFNVDAVVSDLHRRRHPNARHFTGVLTGVLTGA